MSDSNRPPTDYKSVALPDELMGHDTTYATYHGAQGETRTLNPFGTGF